MWLLITDDLLHVKGRRCSRHNAHDRAGTGEVDTDDRRRLGAGAAVRLEGIRRLDVPPLGRLGPRGLLEEHGTGLRRLPAGFLTLACSPTGTPSESPLPHTRSVHDRRVSQTVKWQVIPP